MSLDDDVMALRRSTTLASLEHVARVRVTGADAHAAVDAVCPRELFLYEGQMLHSLLLDEEGQILADLHVARDEEGFFLLADGVSASELVSALQKHAPPSADFLAIALDGTHELVSFNGPYAWELLSEAFTPEVIGLPYLGCAALLDTTCFRTGRVGEYGYDVLVPRAASASFTARLEPFAEEFGLRRVSQAALDVCALENFVFNPRAEGRTLRDPIELQLQWRLSYGKEYPGAGRLRERRTRGPDRRAVLLAGDHELVAGDEVRCGDATIGHVLHAQRSPIRGDFLAVARLKIAYAAPGLEQYAAVRGGVRAPARVISAPAVNNRSVYVDPQRHTHRTRESQDFPPLVLEA
jgi:glycine cleavage system aminomethyltransferase T